MIALGVMPRTEERVSRPHNPTVSVGVWFIEPIPTAACVGNIAARQCSDQLLLLLLPELPRCAAILTLPATAARLLLHTLCSGM